MIDFVLMVSETAMPKNKRKSPVEPKMDRNFRPNSRESDLNASGLPDRIVNFATNKVQFFQNSSTTLKIDEPTLRAKERNLDGKRKVSERHSRDKKQYPFKNSITIIGSSVNTVPLSDEESEEALSDFMVYVSEEDEEKDDFYATYSVNEAASALKEDINTVIKWLDAGKLVGYKRESGERRIPKAQIRNGKVAPALDKLTEFFVNPRLKWDYLVYEQSLGTERVRPLELHFRNDIKFAIGIAAGFGVDFM